MTQEAKETEPLLTKKVLKFGSEDHFRTTSNISDNYTPRSVESEDRAVPHRVLRRLHDRDGSKKNTWKKIGDDEVFQVSRFVNANAPWYIVTTSLIAVFVNMSTVLGAYFLVLADFHLTPKCYDITGQYKTPHRFMCSVTSVCHCTYPLVCMGIALVAFAKNMYDTRLYYECLVQGIMLDYDNYNGTFTSSWAFVLLLIYGILAIGMVYFVSGTDSYSFQLWMYQNMAYLSPILSFIVVLGSTWQIENFLIPLPKFCETDYEAATSLLTHAVYVPEDYFRIAFENSEAGLAMIGRWDNGKGSVIEIRNREGQLVVVQDELKENDETPIRIEESWWVAEGEFGTLRLKLKKDGMLGKFKQVGGEEFGPDQHYHNSEAGLVGEEPMPTELYFAMLKKYCEAEMNFLTRKRKESSMLKDDYTFSERILARFGVHPVMSYAERHDIKPPKKKVDERIRSFRERKGRPRFLYWVYHLLNSKHLKDKRSTQFRGWSFCYLVFAGILALLLVIMIFRTTVTVLCRNHVIAGNSHLQELRLVDDTMMDEAMGTAMWQHANETFRGTPETVHSYINNTMNVAAAGTVSGVGVFSSSPHRSVYEHKFLHPN